MPPPVRLNRRTEETPAITDLVAEKRQRMRLELSRLSPSEVKKLQALYEKMGVPNGSDLM